MSTAQPHGPAPTSVWQLIWHDEFTALDIDKTKWTQPEWHVQNVTTKGNAWQYDGKLVLNLASADVGSLLRSTFEFKPGMTVEARIRFPGGVDPIFNWPAFWTSGPYVNGKTPSGEHDIAEGMKKGLKVSYWDKDRNLGHSVYPAGEWKNAYHTYTLYRRAADARVYWDGKLVAAYDTNDDGGSQAILLSLGSTPDEVPVLGSPSRVRVDYVRVWRRA